MGCFRLLEVCYGTFCLDVSLEIDRRFLVIFREFKGAVSDLSGSFHSELGEGFVFGSPW